MKTTDEENKKVNKKNKIMVVVSAIIVLSLVTLQTGYYVSIIHSRQYSIGPFQSQRKGNVREVAEDIKVSERCIDIKDRKPAQVYKYFNFIALRSESSRFRDIVRKWNVPVRFFAEGDPGELIRGVLNDLFVKMNAIEGFPGIYEVGSKEEANLIGYFYEDEKFNEFISNYGANESYFGISYVDLDEADSSICSGVFAVRTTMSDARKCSVTAEELVQAMGLSNDTRRYSDSLFYQGYKEVLEPNELDWIIFRILYHPLIQSGMNYSQCIPILSMIIAK